MDIAIEEVPFYLDPRGYHPRTWGRVVYSGAAHSDVVTGLTLAASRGAMPLGLRQIADYSDPSRAACTSEEWLTQAIPNVRRELETGLVTRELPIGAANPGQTYRIAAKRLLWVFR